MADHMYKMSEVPKGKRFSQFLDYYKFHTIAVIIAIIAVISLVKTIFFTPDVDLSILLAGSTYAENAVWDEMQQQIEALNPDFNNDGKAIVSFSPNILDERDMNENPEYYVASQQRLIASLAAGDHYVQVADEKMFEYLKEEQLIAGYKDIAGYNIDENLSEEYIKIPLSKLNIFSEETLSKLPSEYYLTLRSLDSLRIEKKEKKLNSYYTQASFVADLIGLEKLETEY